MGTMGTMGTQGFHLILMPTERFPIMVKLWEPWEPMERAREPGRRPIRRCALCVVIRRTSITSALRVCQCRIRRMRKQHRLPSAAADPEPAKRAA
jgi:hypothetical protein